MALAVIPPAHSGCGGQHDFDDWMTIPSGAGTGGLDGGGPSGTSGSGGAVPVTAGAGGTGGADPCPYSTPKIGGGCEPVCGTSFSVGAKIAAISSTAQEGLFGVAENGNILYATSEGGPCAYNRLKLAEKSGTSYVITDLTGDPELAAANWKVAHFGADGKTLVVAYADGTGLLMGELTGTDVGPLSVGPFTNLNANLGLDTVLKVTMSGDGLVIILLRDSADDAHDGHYESRRAGTSVDFPALTRLTGDIQNYWAVDSLSYDGLTAFAMKDFYTSIFTRTSSAAGFTNANITPIAAWEVKVAGTCSTLVAITSPGGCDNQDISLLNRL